MLWPNMDDEQKLTLVRYAKRYLGKTTSDGIKITWDRFGRAVGATGDTLKSYNRRSTAQNSVAGPSEYESKSLRTARRVVQNQSLPVEQRVILAQELLADPEVADQALDMPAEPGEYPNSTAVRAIGNVAQATTRSNNKYKARGEKVTAENPSLKKLGEIAATQDLKLVLLKHAEQVRNFLERAGELQEGERFMLCNALEASEKANQKVRMYLELGRTELDEEIRNLMESESNE